MTIFTKPQSEKEEKEPVSAKELEAQGAVPLSGNILVFSPNDHFPPTNPPVYSDLYIIHRRRRLLTSVCIVLLVLWLALAFVIGGILLFRYFTRRHIVYGWCGTDMADGRHSLQERLQQRVEVDPYYNYEKIDVPKFGDKRPAVFVHDFKQNLTAIVDIGGNQCFIKPLDKKIVPPKSFVDLLRKMEEGYYEQDATVIAERWLARKPALSRDQLSDLGSWMIRDQCGVRQSYLLVKAVTSDSHHGDNSHSGEDIIERVKRDTSECRSERADFVEFVPQNGLYDIQIDIPEC